MSYYTYYVFGISLIFLSFIASFRMQSNHLSKAIYFASPILIILSFYVLPFQIAKLHSLHFYTDFSHWVEIFRSINKTGMPLALSHEFIVPDSMNYFGVHFTPFIYIFSVIYRFFPYSETLIVLNNVILLSTIVPIWKIAKNELKDKIGALTLVLCFLWWPTFQYIALYEFEMLRFCIPLFLWMLYFHHKSNLKGILITALLACMIREEVGLTVCAFGLYCYFTGKRREGVFLILLGTLYFLVTLFIIMPIFQGAGFSGHIAGGSFQYLKGERGIAFVARTILNPLKFANYFMLLVPFVFIPFMKLGLMFAVLPTLAIGIASESIVHSSFMLYYISPMLAFIFYALIFACKKIKSKYSDKTENLIPALFITVLISNVFFGPSPVSIPFWAETIKAAPFRTQNFHWRAYHISKQRKEDLDAILTRIPPSSIVSTQEFLKPQLKDARGLMTFPQVSSRDDSYQAEFVLVDEKNNKLNQESPAYIDKKYFEYFSKNQRWNLIEKKGTYLLYQRLENET